MESFNYVLKYCLYQEWLTLGLMFSHYGFINKFTSGKNKRKQSLYTRDFRRAQNFKRLPRWLTGKESISQCRRHRRHGFDPWVGKIPWRRKWQPTPVFLGYWDTGYWYNPTNRGAWWATVHEVAKSQTGLSNWAHTKNWAAIINLQNLF